MVFGSLVSFFVGCVLSVIYPSIFKLDEPFFFSSLCMFAISNTIAAHVETLLVEYELAIDYKIQTVSETLSLTVGTLSQYFLIVRTNTDPILGYAIAFLASSVIRYVCVATMRISNRGQLGMSLLRFTEVSIRGENLYFTKEQCQLGIQIFKAEIFTKICLEVFNLIVLKDSILLPQLTLLKNLKGLAVRFLLSPIHVYLKLQVFLNSRTSRSIFTPKFFLYTQRIGANFKLLKQSCRYVDYLYLCGGY